MSLFTESCFSNLFHFENTSLEVKKIEEMFDMGSRASELWNDCRKIMGLKKYFSLANRCKLLGFFLELVRFHMHKYVASNFRAAIIFSLNAFFHEGLGRCMFIIV